MSALTPVVRAFCEENPAGVVATRRPDGTVRQSVVYFALDGDNVVISTESKRGKARDVERDGWASLCVIGSAKPYPSVTLEGKAQIVTQGIGAPTALVVSRIVGAPVEQVQTDEQLAAVDRVVLTIAVDSVYGASYLPKGT